MLCDFSLACSSPIFSLSQSSRNIVFFPKTKGLSSLLHKAEEEGRIQGVAVCWRDLEFHFSFLLMIIYSFVRLDLYEQLSGRKANKGKTTLFLGSVYFVVKYFPM